MIKKLGGIVILLGISFMALCQEATTTTKKTSARPDIPGTFMVEFGFNQDVSGPADFSLQFWGSRTANIYYQYDFRILNSSFSFAPGIGLSLERYKFKDNYSIDYPDPTTDEIEMIPAEDLPVPGIKKSMLITNYVEAPLEIRYTMNPDDPSRSFKVSVGARVGYLFDSFTKIKYTENSEVKKYKDKQDFNLTKFRYGLVGRMGFGPFGFFGYYNLTPLFEEGKGLKTDGLSNDFNTWTVGLTLSGF